MWLISTKMGINVKFFTFLPKIGKNHHFLRHNYNQKWYFGL